MTTPKLEQCTAPLSIIKCVCHGPESDLDPSRGRFPRDPDSAENDPSAEAVSRRPKPWVSDTTAQIPNDEKQCNKVLSLILDERSSLKYQVKYLISKINNKSLSSLSCVRNLL